VDGRLYWVGANPSGVFAFDGGKVEKVSSLAIDKILSERQYYAVSVIGWQGQRALSICLDTPDAATQRALVFLPRWNDWFEWSSTVFIPQASSRLQSVCLGVGSNQHKLYAISETSDNWQDAGGNYTRTIQFELPTGSNARNFMRWLGLKGTIERSACTETVSVSDDDGQNWVSLGTIDRTANKQHIYRGGSYQRGRFASPIPPTMKAGWRRSSRGSIDLPRHPVEEAGNSSGWKRIGESAEDHRVLFRHDARFDDYRAARRDEGQHSE
jgi:hypothetical protein